MKGRSRVKGLSRFAIFLLAAGCASGEPAVLDSVDPRVGQLPVTVTLTGSLFGPDDAESHLVAWTLDEADSTRIVLDERVESWSDTEIRFALPEDFLGPMFDERPFALHIEHSDAVSNCLRFDAVLPPDPRIADISPPATRVGVELTISGLSFGDEPGVVRFASSADGSAVEGAVSSWSENEVRVTVPEGGDGGSLRIESALGLLSRPYPFVVADPDAPTLSLLQATIFTPRCAVGACHGTALAGGLSLFDGESFANLVSVGSSELAGSLRVQPFSPDDSLLMDKLINDRPAVGARMPLGGPYLSGEQVALVRAWIERGAMND